MRQILSFLLLGFGSAAAGFCALYFTATAPHRALLDSHDPELAWLRREFKVSDDEFDRISALHSGYNDRCAEMCVKIDKKNRQVRELLQSSTELTPAIETALDEAAQLRLECQKQMLEHFIRVSQMMPPDQGRRYLAWIQEQTLVMDPATRGH